jgi:fatty-acyl-CoA synthase
VRYTLQEGMTVLDPETMADVPADGQTMGEIMFRGNIVMKGYLKNPAPPQGLRGRLVPHRRPGGDGARPLREDQGPQQGHHHQAARTSARIEVEDALYRHPAVPSCAVVARPDDKWGETPVAYRRTPKPGATVTRRRTDHPLQGLLAGYKVPREIRFEPIPKTSTGKIQKFQLRERAKVRPV